MFPPLAQNTSITPISEPPATTPDATGQSEFLSKLRFAFLNEERNERTQEEQEPIIPVEHPGEAERRRRGKVLLVIRQQKGRGVSSTTPTTSPTNISRSFTGSSEVKP